MYSFAFTAEWHEFPQSEGLASAVNLPEAAPTRFLHSDQIPVNKDFPDRQRLFVRKKSRSWW